MKLMKSFIQYFYLIVFLLLIGVIELYAYQPEILTQFAYLNWLALLVVVVILCSPAGKIKLTTKENPQKKLPIKAWVTRILCLQIALMLVFIGLSYLTGTLLPINTTAHKTLLLNDFSTSLLHFKLYPWALIALFAAAFALSTHRQQRHTYVSTLCASPNNKKFEIFNVSANLIGRACTMLLIGLAILTATVFAASLMAGPAALQKITGFTVAAVSSSFLLLFITLRRKISQLLSSLENQKPILGVIINTLIWAVVLCLLALAVHHTGTGKNQMPLFFKSILDKGWHLHWELLSQMYWLCTVPISAILIAKFSQGYSLRAMLLTTLALPLLLAGLLLGVKQFAPHFHWPLPYLAALIADLVGFVLLITLLFNKNHLPLTSQCYLPKPGKAKPRNKELFTTRWKKMCGLVFYLFIPAGVYVLSILSSLLTLPMLLITLGVIFKMTQWLRPAELK